MSVSKNVIGASSPEQSPRGGLGRRDVVALIGATAFAGVVHAADGNIATTRWGRVRGAFSDGVYSFKGVRYGADTAPRRFRAPAPPTPWADVRPAFEYGASAPQRGGTEHPQSEDCLFLNVWTPGLRDGGRRPVMVYLHGGGHDSGSGSSPLYDGTNLCRRNDGVVVTLNHRLNAFGYCYLSELYPDRFPAGNAGIMDLVLALRWVRDNIAEFGGDPGRVMIFGQSGGGDKVDTLMAMPDAAGLYHRAATMSGSQVTAIGPLAATRKTRAFMAALKLDPTQIEPMLTMPMARLVEALETPDPDVPSGRIIWGPVLDEVTLPRHPYYPDAPAVSASVPMIIGSTHDETRYFLRNNAKAFDLGWADLPDILAREMKEDISPRYVIEQYRRMYPGYSASQVLFAATTAGRSWRGHLIKAERRARRETRTWVYQLDFASPIDGGRFGAMHTLDIPLVFDTIAAPGSMTGTSPAAAHVATMMGKAFSALAASGNPNISALPRWPVFDLRHRSTMIFDNVPNVVDDPRSGERKLFSTVPYIKPGT